MPQVLPIVPSPREFFEKFIATRTPVVIDSLDWVNYKHLSDLNKLQSINEIVKVESKHHGHFGSGKRRIEMPFSEFIEKLVEGDSNLYLTTQCNEQYPYIQPPLTASDFTNPTILGNLVPQQVNLWIGSQSKDSASLASSSGLHHDFADNLYCLLKGRKRFVIFPPSDAKLMKLHGKVCNIFANGLIAYDKDIRSDGAHRIDVLQYKLDKLESMTDPDLDEKEELEDALFDMQCGASRSFLKQPKQPPSFSKISVNDLHDASFLGLKDAHRIEFYLEDGQMLYLPAGWFHEVTSYGNVHIAVNFWHHPPATQNFEQPYEDDYWKDWFDGLDEHKINIEHD